jgi:hypothetical protein
MTTSATLQKRQELLDFIELELRPEPAVQGVIGVGSIANGLARPDSDIDAIVFLDPFDPYLTPAEFVWCPAERSFHSIFSDAVGIQFDFQRFDLKQWADPAFAWPEGYCAELRAGWLAFDRGGRVAELIAARTTYSDALRIARLDEAITYLDQHLADDGPQARWDSLGFLAAHDRLHAAYNYLVQALFAYNRCWRPWRNREMPALLALPWLPQDFVHRVGGAWGISSQDYPAYWSRVEVLRALFQELTTRLVQDGLYGENLTGEAFIRGHAEPGRAWNMDEWNVRHAERHQSLHA